MKGRSQEKAPVRLQPACFSLVGKCFVDAGEWRSRVKGHVPHTSHGNEMNDNKTVDLILLVSSTFNRCTVATRLFVKSGMKVWSHFLGIHGSMGPPSSAD